MSEHADIRFEPREDLNFLLGKREVGESSSYHSSLWMAHWTDRTENNQGPISQAEQVVIGMNRQTTTNSNQLSTSMNENFGFYFNSVTENAVVSPDMKDCQLLEGSDHFPMYGIKRKMESIFNPKGKALYEDRISELNVSFHSSKELCFETQLQNPRNHRLTALGPCSCTKEGSFSASSEIKCPSHNARTQSMNFPDRSSGSSKRRAAFLYEMVSVPTESYDVAQFRNKSKSCEENFKGDGRISNLRKVEGQFEHSDGLPLDNTKVLGSAGGLASSRAQKVTTCRNSTRSNFRATASTGKSPTRDKHIESLNTNLDPGPSWTVTMDATESLSKSSAEPKLDTNLMEIQGKPSIKEVHSNQWLKRLRHDISSNAITLKQKNVNSPRPISEQTMESWIQRWGINILPSGGGEKFGVVPREAEIEGRQFPSLAAMAMIGRAIKKFRPVKFQRRGPSVVWKNNEF